MARQYVAPRAFSATDTLAAVSPIAMVTPVKEMTSGGGGGTLDAYHTQLFVTPSASGTRVGCRSTPSSGASTSSRLGACPSTGSSKRAQHIVYNPFETGLLDRLRHPVCSPSVFAKAQCPGSDEKTPKHFRWSIDQLAILMPVEIEETAAQPADSLVFADINRKTDEPTPEFHMDVPDYATFKDLHCGLKESFAMVTDQRLSDFLWPYGVELNDKIKDLYKGSYDHPVQIEAQRAIDTFFVMQPVLPSPWTDSAKRKPFTLPMTPGAESDGCSPAMAPGPPPPTSVTSAAMSATREVSCQTSLSLPSDFDLTKVLAEYYTAALADDLPTTPGDLSTSSLRRKLFFHGDDGTPLSPVRDRVSFQSCAITPPDVAVNSDRLVSPSDGPLCQFSSSPIHRSATTGGDGGRCESSWLRRCSTVRDVMASPQLSPVDQRHVDERDRRSSFDGSFSWSMSHQGSPTPRCRPQTRVCSPDMSPITTTSFTPLSRAGGQGRSSWSTNRDHHRQSRSATTQLTDRTTTAWCSGHHHYHRGDAQDMDVDTSSSCLPQDHDTGYSTANHDSAPMADMSDTEVAMTRDVGHSDLTHPFSHMGTGGHGKRSSAATWCVERHAHVRPSQYVEELLRHARDDIDRYCPVVSGTLDTAADCAMEPPIT